VLLAGFKAPSLENAAIITVSKAFSPFKSSS